MLRTAVSAAQRAIPKSAFPVHSRHGAAFSASAAAEPKPLKFQLNNLQDNPGATKQRKRVGRGYGSGMGKTSTRGMKGQKARSGGSIRPGFEGGQTPLARRLPKVGFSNARFARDFEVVNLASLQQWIDKGRLDASKPITLRDLWLSGLVGRSVKQGIKLLGSGAQAFNAKLDIEVSDASISAIARVEECGGNIVTKHFSRVALRAHLKPEKFAVQPKAPAPGPKHMKHYLSDAKRGYLSRHVQLKQHAARASAVSSSS